VPHPFAHFAKGWDSTIPSPVILTEVEEPALSDAEGKSAALSPRGVPGTTVEGHGFSRAENILSHLSFRIRFSGEESAFPRRLFSRVDRATTLTYAPTLP